MRRPRPGHPRAGGDPIIFPARRPETVPDTVFQSDTKYTRVVTRDGEALVKKTLRELAAELDARHFWQVHRGTIVNIRAIAWVSSDEAGRREITLAERPEKLEVSRTFAHLFKSS